MWQIRYFLEVEVIWILSSGSVRSFLLSVGLMLTGEFTLLEEPTEDSDVVAAVVLLADRLKYIRSETRRKPRDPM
jgi:hypothetical protein